MNIKCFSELTQDEKEKLYNFIISFGDCHFFENFQGMESTYNSVVFNNGESHYSLWDQSGVIASTGLITKEISEKGEAFITGIFIQEKDQEKLEMLLDAALKNIGAYPPLQVRLGLLAERQYLIPVVEKYGFSQNYHAVILKHMVSEEMRNRNNGNRLTTKILGWNNWKIYQKIHNEAFRHVPNGGLLSDEEMKGILERKDDKKVIVELIYIENQPIGVCELSVKKDIGWIEAIAIAPEWQGKGIGKAALNKVEHMLMQEGAEAIKLIVVSSNEKAYRLYERNGFKKEKILSYWFEKVTE